MNGIIMQKEIMIIKDIGMFIWEGLEGRKKVINDVIIVWCIFFVLCVLGILKMALPIVLCVFPHFQEVNHIPFI